ncbi:MAG: sensor histidine kinase [Lachnospiraceae bacterium]|nr:sensor histidine kinase [Lachnospiraceae bacterium]
MKKLDLKWSMILLLVFIWLVPILTASFVVYFLVSDKMSAQLSAELSISMNKAVYSIDTGLDECVNASRNATYFNVISDNWSAYKKNGEKQALYDSMTIYLSTQYRFNRNLDTTMVFFTEDPELFYSTYSSGSSYDNVIHFKDNYLKDALKAGETLDTGIMLYSGGDSLYLFRNLLNDRYKPFAMIVMELNKSNIFDPLNTVWAYDEAYVFLNGACVSGREVSLPGVFELDKATDGPVVEKFDKDYYIYLTENYNGSFLSYVVKLDSGLLFGEIRATYYILVIVLASLIPLVVALFVYLRKRVSDPVGNLVTAAREISNGNYGYHITGKSAGSREFDYLNDSFNTMSDELKNQFEKIYVEEIALRDANIKALQSQINPHFLNNTLEIINWEARLNGVYKVSSMIEALSTMLNSTLNRKDEKTIALREEMEYVDAYLYIISERMGKRLTITKNVDERLLGTEVPRLIIQPIVENAVEHGTKASVESRISIDIYEKDEYMYIAVRNTGNMSSEDIAKVKHLLFDEETSEKHHASIGIRNVNKRLKLMYGDDCGLNIYNEGTDTVSLLTLKIGGGRE